MEKSYICRFLLRYDIFWSFKTICPLLYIVYVLYILCAIYYIAWFPDIDVPILDYFKCRIGLKSNDDNSITICLRYLQQFRQNHLKYVMMNHVKLSFSFIPIIISESLIMHYNNNGDKE